MADGGTRTAAITGSYVSLNLALKKLIAKNLIDPEILITPVSAVSVGILENEPILDLCYQEDRNAEVDLNIVMNSKGEFIEVQGTAETKPFSRKKLDQLLNLAENGIQELFEIQHKALSGQDHN
jgi:ribonuclease PH